MHIFLLFSVPGSSASGRGSPFCSACSRGSYSSSVSTCTLCSPGYYSTNTGLTVCSACSPGSASLEFEMCVIVLSMTRNYGPCSQALIRRLPMQLRRMFVKHAPLGCFPWLRPPTRVPYVCHVSMVSFGFRTLICSC